MNDLLTINPYNLLGVNTKSTINELKKAYYNLALMCHPDKGGDEKDMVVVSNAYRYIKDQLIKIEFKKDVTYENLEEEFKLFCEEQESKPPKFSYIYEETNDWIKDFNREFEKGIHENKDNLPFQYGYGDLMDNHEELKENEYVETESIKVKNEFKKEIVEYKEPIMLPDCIDYYPLNIEKINDYSLKNNNLDMTDYKKAHTEDILNDEYEEDNLDIIKKFNQELKDRNINI